MCIVASSRKHPEIFSQIENNIISSLLFSYAQNPGCLLKVWAGSDVEKWKR
jgi:hypothetical protein